MAYNPLKEVKENAVIKEVKAIIALTDLSIQRINSGAFSIGSGSKRRFVGIECKRPSGGRLSTAQRRRIQDINRKGGVAFVARSGQEAYQQLKDHGCF